MRSTQVQRCLPAIAAVYTAVLAHQRSTTHSRHHSSVTASAVPGASLHLACAHNSSATVARQLF
eukprot:11335-Heterococcus_DN1.PRE.2